MFSRSAIQPVLGRIVVLGCLIVAPCMVFATDYFVAADGDDADPGTSSAPFRTIGRAAEIAMPGDTVTVRAGVYREWVRPARGGTDEEHRIVYQAEAGADVRIVGSEPATGWEAAESGVWKIDLPAARFGDFNPFATLTRHPEYIELDESGDGWGWLRYGRWTHLGDVFIDGEGLTERESLEGVYASPSSWYSAIDEGVTTIWANFGDLDPNESSVELNHRPFAFFPEKAGLNYITLRGFTILNVASHWAPPVVFQPGAIGTNGGHHWIIEENIVLYAKAVAISIGNPDEPGDPELGGRHIIRNNVIMRAGQAGIAGQSYNQQSTISNNHIEDTNYRKEFGGWETAAIKLHNGDGLNISGNFIRKVATIDPEVGAAHGIWNDFRNSNWRVDGNIVIGAEGNAILTEANWEGPNLYSNNILIGGRIGTYSSRGDAWVHNLFVNTPQRWENQTWGDRAAVGDARWLSNVFVEVGPQADIDADNSVFDHNVYLDGAVPHDDDRNAVTSADEGSKLTLVESNEGVSLSYFTEAVVPADHPLVTHESLRLPFSIDVTVSKDFFGEARNDGSNRAGPINLSAMGDTDVSIYVYPGLYYRALQLIDGG